MPPSLPLLVVSHSKTAKMSAAAEQEQPMMEAFQALDKDKTGKIDAQQLRQILATLGDVLSSDEIDNLFKEVSIGSEGLDYQTFVNTLVHSYSLKDRPPPYVPFTANARASLCFARLLCGQLGGAGGGLCACVVCCDLVCLFVCVSVCLCLCSGVCGVCVCAAIDSQHILSRRFV